MTQARLGPLAYLLSGVREFVGLNPIRGRFLVDGRPVCYPGNFLLFAVGNGWQDGRRQSRDPLGEAGDGALDLLIITAHSRLALLALLPELRAGTPPRPAGRALHAGKGDRRGQARSSRSTRMGAAAVEEAAVHGRSWGGDGDGLVAGGRAGSGPSSPMKTGRDAPCAPARRSRQCGVADRRGPA